MESYEEWDITIPAIPPRSRLYRLEPIGVGTPYVESLISYIMRLANAHCVTLQVLVKKEIFPLYNQTGTIQNSNSWLGKLWWVGVPVLNGMSPITTQWVQVLQTLTFCDNLRFLTMLTWSEMIGIAKLLRRKKAWCPQCFLEWRQKRHIIYEPLLWSLSTVDICPLHQRPLATLCQYCQKTQPFLKQIAYPGYCMHCMRWLGTHFVASNVVVMSNTIEMDRWRAIVIGELLASAPTLLKTPSREQFFDVLDHYLNRYAKGNSTVFARLLKIPVPTLNSYIQQSSIPSFDSFMQLSYSLSVKPLEFLSASPIPSQKIPHFVLDSLPARIPSKGKPVTETDIQFMRQALKTVLEIDKDNPFPFPNLRQIAQRIGYHTATLRKHCPELSQAVVMRYRQLWTGDKAYTRMVQALEIALVTDKPIPLEAVAKQLGCTSSVLYEHLPDLSRSVVTRYRGERPSKKQTQQQLQVMLNSGEKLVSVKETARQLGYKISYFEKNFPEICQEIASRHRVERRNQCEELAEITCTAIHQTVKALHQQGVYPSSERVAKELNNLHILRKKESRMAWIRALEECGYLTDYLKKYI